MGSFIYVIINYKGGDIMSFASFVTKLSDNINDGIRAFANSGIPGKVVGTATAGGLKVGKAVGNVGFKVGMGAINKGLDGVNFVLDNQESIKKGLKYMGKDVLNEANVWTQAGFGMIEKFDNTFLKKAPLTKSLIGRSFNKRGLALATTGALVIGTGQGASQYLQDRQGSNDGQLYTPTARMSTPYQLSEQMAYSQHGRSFADNAGATGDLVFALNNMRNG